MIRTQWIRAVSAAVIRAHRTPVEVGTAIGVGVFLGCTPFFGFHTVLALAASFLFGLNFVYVWLGTQISNPLLAGFLTVGSISVGHYLLHGASHSLGRLSLDWLAGSVVIGSVLGTIAGVVSFGAARRYSKAVAPPTQTEPPATSPAASN
jgi:uncharacterized protein (DUF2062 family)